MSEDTTGGRLARTEARAGKTTSLAKQYLSLAAPEDRLVVTDWPDRWPGTTVDACDIAAVTAAVNALLHRHNPEDRPAAIVFDIADRDDQELISVMNTAGQHARRRNCHVTIVID